MNIGMMLVDASSRTFTCVGEDRERMPEDIWSSLMPLKHWAVITPCVCFFCFAAPSLTDIRRRLAAWYASDIVDAVDCVVKVEAGVAEDSEDVVAPVKVE